MQRHQTNYLASYQTTEAVSLSDSITAVDVPADATVYAECDEVRRMINTFLASSGVKQTQWLSAIGCQPISLKNFLGFKGAGAGAGNGVYPMAYRYFEQQRILEGKPKTSK
jgi:hypothetical protein